MRFFWPKMPHAHDQSISLTPGNGCSSASASPLRRYPFPSPSRCRAHLLGRMSKQERNGILFIEQMRTGRREREWIKFTSGILTWNENYFKCKLLETLVLMKDNQITGKNKWKMHLLSIQFAHNYIHVNTMNIWIWKMKRQQIAFRSRHSVVFTNKFQLGCTHTNAPMLTTWMFCGGVRAKFNGTDFLSSSHQFSMGFLIMNKKSLRQRWRWQQRHRRKRRPRETANEMMLNEGNKKQFWFWNI